MNEPSKVTLDFYNTERLFLDRARLYQREEELGRLRRQLADCEDQLFQASAASQVQISNAEDSARAEAFDEVRKMLLEFDTKGIRYKKQVVVALTSIYHQIDVISPPF